MATVVVALNAATIAYKKAIQKTRKEISSGTKDTPLWMKEFANRLPEQEEEADEEPEVLDRHAHRKEKLGNGNSSNPYEMIAFWVYVKIVGTSWFESFILSCILLVGIATGVDLENPEPTPGVSAFVSITSTTTMIIFTMECTLKIISYGYNPLGYFVDAEDGGFNTFDFFIVVAGFCFMGNANGSAIGALRLLRLLRLLTFIKGVPQLRVIVSGLLSGAKSVSYIVILLFLVVYLFSIMGCLFFGVNDTARFGTVPMSMISLFQVSTLASWTSIAYTSMFGCSAFLQDPYAGGEDGHPSKIFTKAGEFQGFRCDKDIPKPGITFIFFSVYIVLTSWVIMSLFIGVISMGMFEALEKMKEDRKQSQYRRKLAEVSNMQSDSFHETHKRKVTGILGTLCGSAGQNEEELSGKAKLKKLIDRALGPEEQHIETSAFEHNYMLGAKKCMNIEKSSWFSCLITSTIVVVGIMIGIETDSALTCRRFVSLNHGDDKGSPHCLVSTASFSIAIIAQIIFTCEAGIKICANGMTPLKYFHDSWNRLDFFIVIVGFLEMSDASFLFEAFPVVILRLLRLLRVFRLAKAFPRLRSIVEALISGFSSVGWICILIIVFNYIIGCMCMLVMAPNDPFHFGSVGRSVFTVLRLETGDSWDQVLYINMYGCAGFPAAYPLVDPEVYAQMKCDNDLALGWLSALIFIFIIIMGTYVLPTVLIGIVVISFDDASRRASAIEEMIQKTEEQVESAKSEMPDFFTEHRIQLMEDVFEEMDADGELSLDINEMTPFYEYVFKHLFKVTLSKEQQEQVFHLMDVDGDTELGFAEFVMFLVVVKQIEEKAKVDPNLFPPSMSLNEEPERLIEKNSASCESLQENVVNEIKERVEQTDEKNASEEDPMKIGDLCGSPDANRSLREVIEASIDRRRIGNRLKGSRSGAQNKAIDDVIHQLSEELMKAASSITKVTSDKNIVLPTNGAKEVKAAYTSSSSTPCHEDRIAEALPDERLIPQQSALLIPDPDRGAGGTALNSGRENKENIWAAILQLVRKDGAAFISNIDKVYEKFDTDGDGSLDILELSSGLMSMGCQISVHDTASLLREMDVDGDGTISADEFETAIQARDEGFAKLAAWSRVLNLLDGDPSKFAKDVDKVFDAFDADGDGNIDIEELAKGLLSLGVYMNDGQLRAFCEELDADGDDSITKDEFIQAICLRRPSFNENRNTLDPVLLAALDEAWKRILECIYDDPKVWQRSVEMLFMSFDRNGDGFINISEISKGLTSFGVRLNPQQLKAFYQDLDINNDGLISLFEFMQRVEERQASGQHQGETPQRAESRTEHRGPPSDDGVWVTYSKTQARNNNAATRSAYGEDVKRPERTPSLTALLNESRSIFGDQDQFRPEAIHQPAVDNNNNNNHIIGRPTMAAEQNREAAKHQTRQKSEGYRDAYSTGRTTMSTTEQNRGTAGHQIGQQPTRDRYSYTTGRTTKYGRGVEGQQIGQQPSGERYSYSAGRATMATTKRDQGTANGDKRSSGNSGNRYSGGRTARLQTTAGSTVMPNRSNAYEHRAQKTQPRPQLPPAETFMRIRSWSQDSTY